METTTRDYCVMHIERIYHINYIYKKYPTIHGLDIPVRVVQTNIDGKTIAHWRTKKQIA